MPRYSTGVPVINGKRVFAIIPARGGSKGLPGKNLKPICGKPLIGWTIEKALKSKLIDTLIVSTDDAEIASVAEQCGALVPFIRPDELATDEATTFSVIKHALQWFEKTYDETFHYTVLLEPTSPLREDDDIDRMLQLLDLHSREAHGVMSVGLVHEHPALMKEVIHPYIHNAPYTRRTPLDLRRQALEPIYFPFGVAYMSKTNTLLASGTFYTDKCLPFVVKRYQCHEIDDIYDLLAVEAVMKYEWGIA